MSKMIIKVLFVRFDDGSITAETATDAKSYGKNPPYFDSLHADILDSLDGEKFTHAVVDIEVDVAIVAAACTPKTVQIKGKVL